MNILLDKSFCTTFHHKLIPLIKRFFCCCWENLVLFIFSRREIYWSRIFQYFWSHTVSDIVQGFRALVVSKTDVGPSPVALNLKVKMWECVLSIISRCWIDVFWIFQSVLGINWLNTTSHHHYVFRNCIL